MASEKKPSIYSDRGTIGSSSELDEYGVWVKSEPQDLSQAGSDAGDLSAASLPDFDADFDTDSFDSGFGDMDIPDLDIPDDTLNSGDESQAGGALFDEADSESVEGLADLSLDLDGESGAGGDTFTESVLDTASDFDDFSLPDIDSDAAESDSQSVYEEEGFTEVAMEDFLDEAPIEPQTVSAAASRPDLSTELLMKIADELSSIKKELSTLKHDFANVRAAAPADAAAHGGFFAEEEDEKIALTGDELDNILNTADFTEEAGEDATEELEGEFSFPGVEDLLSSDPFQENEELSIDSLEDPLEPRDDDNLSADLSDQEDSGAAEEEIDISLESETGGTAEIEQTEFADDTFESIESEAEIPQTFDNIEIDEDLAKIESDEPRIEPDDFIETDDSDGLAQLREEGVEPMTAAPEDTSYLEDDSPLDETALDMPPADETVTDETSVDISLDENLADDFFEETAVEETVTEETTEEISLDISLDDDLAQTDEIAETEETEETAREENIDLDVPFEIELNDVETAEASEAGDEITDEAEPSFDEIEMDLSDALVDESGISMDLGDEASQESSAEMLDNLANEMEIDIENSEDLAASADAALSDMMESGEIEISDDVTISDDEDSAEGLEVIPEGFAETADISLEDELTAEENEELTILDNPPADDLALTADEPEAKETAGESEIPSGIKDELKTVLSYMDQLLESLPEEKIEEFARSDYFDTYKKIFKELGLV